jgi:hypothetical protein
MIMKKLVTALALCAAMSAVAQVESANIVGYNNVILNPGMNYIGVNFQDINALTNGISLDVLFPGSDTNYNRGVSATTGDSVMVWTGSGYNTYWLYFSGTKSMNNLWVANATTPAPIKLKNGDGVWFNRKGATSITATVAGQVPWDAAKTYQIQTGMNAIGGFFAANFDLNNCGIDWATYVDVDGKTASKGVSATTGDSVMVWTGSGYNTYWLYFSGTKSMNNKWVANATTPAPTDIIPIGRGVWYSHKGTGFKLPVTRPY